MTTKASSAPKRAPTRSKPVLRVAASNDALAQIELIAGTEDASILIRTIHWDKSEAGKAKFPPRELQGTFGNLAPDLRRLNADGYNVYMLAQVAGRISGRYVTNSDITAVRCIYVDGDESALPQSWHVPPTFTLVHPNGRWWAVWRVQGLALEDARDLIKRAALRYGGDEKVCNLARVIRLASFDRWKDGERSEPYRLHVLSSETTEAYEHQGLPALPPRKKTTKDPSAPDVMEIGRLRALLARIEPVSRGDWIKVGLVIRDGTVIDQEGRELDDADKRALFDEWSSGDLWRKTPDGERLPHCDVGNYQGYEDCENALETPQASKTDLATFGSIVHLAREHCQRHSVNFSPELGHPGKPERTYEMRQSFDAVAAYSADDDGIELYNGPEYANRPRGEWLVRNVCEMGKLSIASGPRGAGKSIGELALALSVATGKPWLGCEVATRQVVIWVAAEGQGRIWSDVLAQCDLMGIAPDNLRNWLFIYPLHAHLNSDTGKKRLETILQKVRKLGLEPGYIVFDTLSRNMVGNVSDDKDVSAALATALELNEAGIAVTLIAHFGKDANLGTRGSVQWEADADQVRYYKGKPRDGNACIELEKVKLEGNDGTKINVRYEKRQLADGSVGHVILRSEAAEQHKQDFKRAPNQHTRPRNVVLDILERAALRALKAYPAREFNRKHFVELLTDEPEVDLEAQTITRHYLSDLLKDRDRQLHRFYDKAKRTLRYGSAAGK